MTTVDAEIVSMDRDAPASVAVSRLSAGVPSGWTWKESMTLFDPDGDANVIFSSEPVGAEQDSGRYAEIQGKALAESFPGYHQIAFEQMPMLGGRDGFMRRFEWQPEDGRRVTQIQLYYVENDRGYTATATSPTAAFQKQSPALVQILESLRIDGAGSNEDPTGESIDIGAATVVKDNPTENRYEAWVEDTLAGVAHYQLRPGLIAIFHTQVADQFQGRGLADRLAVAALEDARAKNLQVLPFCPLVDSYIQGHPAYVELVPAEQRPAFGL
jgi:predicted GNAT family acetyltransferase